MEACFHSGNIVRLLLLLLASTSSIAQAELLDDQFEHLDAKSIGANQHLVIPTVSYTGQGIISERLHASRTHKTSGEEEKQEVVVEGKELASEVCYTTRADGSPSGGADATDRAPQQAEPCEAGVHLPGKDLQFHQYTQTGSSREFVPSQVEPTSGVVLTQKQAAEKATETVFKLQKKGGGDTDAHHLIGKSADRFHHDDQTLWKASSWHFVEGEETEVVEKDVDGKSDQHESNWQLVLGRVPRSSDKAPASGTAYANVLGKSSELLPDVSLPSRQARGLLATEKTVASYSDLTNGVNTNGYATLRLIASFAVTGMVSISRTLTIKSDTSLCGGRCTISGSVSRFLLFTSMHPMTVPMLNLLNLTICGAGNDTNKSYVTSTQENQ